MQTQNEVLKQLPPAELEALLKKARPFEMRLGDILHRPDDQVDFVFFPNRGVISIITQNQLGECSEAGVIGREAGALLPEALSSGLSTTTGTVQMAGDALKVPASECRRLYEESPRFRAAIAATSEFQMIEGRQSLLCRSFHKLEGRLARWILEQADRSNQEAATLDLTQEFLAAMLAVHRPTVSRAAKALQKTGAINYTRGRLTLTSAKKLEVLACPCRAELQEARKRVFTTA